MTRVLRVIAVAVFGAIVSSALMSALIVVFRTINLPEEEVFNGQREVVAFLIMVSVMALTGAVTGAIVSLFRLKPLLGALIGAFCGLAPLALLIVIAVVLEGPKSFSHPSERSLLLKITAIFVFTGMFPGWACGLFSPRRDKRAGARDQPLPPPPPGHFGV